MLSMIENVFIFGVILPAIITIIVFVGFLICWFKCDLREKILKKCMFKKRQNSSASTSTAHSGRRIHYIKDTLDSNSAGSKDRHHSGGSASITAHYTTNQLHEIPSASDTSANHSNMGFEIEEDFRYINNKNSSIVDTELAVHRPVSSTDNLQSEIHRHTYKSNNSTPVGQRHVNVDNNVVYNQVLNNQHNISSSEDSPNVCTKNNVQCKTELKKRDHIKPWGTPSHVNVYNLSSQSSSSGVHKSPSKSKTPQRRSDFVHQVFQFPHGNHHSRKLATKTNGISLDNSTSSYSSSSNEGDYYERDSDYGHFLPAIHYSTKDISHSPSSRRNNTITQKTNSAGPPKYKSAIKILRQYQPPVQSAEVVTDTSDSTCTDTSFHQHTISVPKDYNEQNPQIYNCHNALQIHSSHPTGQNLQHYAIDVDMLNAGNSQSIV